MFGEDEAIALSNLDDPQSQVPRQEIIDNAIADAGEMIDGYLRSAGYTLPLSANVTVLKRATCDVARYYLDRVRPREDVKMRHDSWLKWLGDVAKGNVELGIPNGNDDVSAFSGESAESWSGGQTFTSDSLRRYINGCCY